MTAIEASVGTQVAEITGSSFILLGVLVVVVFAVAYGLFTRQGSGINKHPRGDSQDPVVGDETKQTNEDLQGDERAGVDRTESAEMDQRGTK
ncbi:MAG: hypothetical protein M3Q53_02465 [Actinomycetota bacterium]|nr:hypothetical protein [Actinomycetota bacterium]